MIVFDLRCAKDHVFEAWFGDSSTFEAQAAEGDVACPICGDSKVVKAPMAPNVARRRSAPVSQAGTNGASSEAAQHMAKTARMLRAMREVVEKNFDHVGQRFPEEARKIHYGEIEWRNIYGDATREEVGALKDEGIEVGQIPFLPRHDA